ncbi:DNA repair ATPase [Lysobacter capsici]|uniref:DNA repair ATPase n=1 Tax=Lysobacter capsici TaxID=435897 RepID=UPI00287B67D3|nr:DNA repair ATPase [Lysobacter capsici]WND81078.1 DNA repair ATPase [Lysobacter capsici]WND86274.1 DNA repair ATPase [Lysobacter capsici]
MADTKPTAAKSTAPAPNTAAGDISNDSAKAAAHAAVDQAVAQGGAYEVLSKRLSEQGLRLRGIAQGLNQQRLNEFGSSQMEVVGRFRIRTENNCVARDIVQVGDLLLFGYNVFMGLKKETVVADVFSLYKLVQGPEGYDVTPVELKGSFLGIDSFAQDFRELYAYYKHTRLIQLIVRDGKLLAAFQIGERITDLRVFRWSVSPSGEVRYIDNRGERDIALPAPFDFEWTRATREMVVNGRHPHLNILDSVFVETVNGDLTIKVENNTEDGKGIYRESVEDKTQSLDDAQVDFAKVGSLILLKILPYREEQWRYLVFNTLTRKVLRQDAIGLACIQLPEDHGIIFPGGYYLQNGEHKSFDQSMDGMRYKRSIRSPNGEDVLYLFYEPEQGRTAMFTYNMIERRLQTPIFGHGYARLDDGRMVIFATESDEPTRVHPMQVWQTPYFSDEYAAKQPAGNSFMGKIGNAELVRGVSELMSLSREIEANEVSAKRYGLLAQNTRRLFDAHHWLSDPNCGETAPLLREIAATAESVLDEYEKVEGIRNQSDRAMREAQSKQKALLDSLQPENWEKVQDFVDALNGLTAQRGHLLTIREYRYIDVAAIDAMEQALVAEHERIGAATGEFLAGDKALAPLAERLAALDAQAQQATTVAQLVEPLEQMRAMSGDLDMLSALMATLKVDDATQRTRIVEAISEIYSKLNQAKARADQRRKGLGSAESVAQFGAQFSLFGQSIASALSLAQDPEKADEQLSRLMVQLEELESQFGEHEAFLGDILSKREELLETFEAHKQTLMDDRQRKAQAVMDAATRILDGLGRRTARFATADELNAFFAGDALILKLRELAERLRALKDSVKADDVEARMKGARDQAVRALRDRSELFEEGGNVIKLGPRHRFSVNTQELDLTLLPRGDVLNLHLTGTDFFEPLNNPDLDAARAYWGVSMDSESPQLYRGEYLAGLVIEAAAGNREGLTLDLLHQQLAQPEVLGRTVRDFAAPRYREGYEKGIHDHDATLILQALLPLRASAGRLAFEPAARAWAALYWSQVAQHEPQKQWPERARTSADIQRLFGSASGLDALRCEIAEAMSAYAQQHTLAIDPALTPRAAEYLVQELSDERPQFVFSKYAQQLLQALREKLTAARMWDGFAAALDGLGDRIAARWALAMNWIEALARAPELAPLAGYAAEAATLLLLDQRFPKKITETDLSASVQGLLGEHPRVKDGRMTLAIDDWSARLRHHRESFVPGFQRYQTLRHEIVGRERHALRLDEFKPRPLSSFVRNKLINDVYLSVIGDNLAKQMGTVGESKRSDLMGLLMMISPPGYGKTTLMEYVAHRLGLIFMKINGPALGHEVRSLDPEQAPDATSRQELEKLNLALEMGNNVMLYVDDIQHTHPEFLQKFISLCDGTRRIEGVWKGRTRTYDMRGKKFCVVMAGNPYTESGEVFKIPDMLANRADIYNLGDVLGGMEASFVLSYIENSLTSNPVLAPLATREMADLYRFVAKAEGKPFSANELSHAYSGAEINEIVATLERLIQVREVVYKVNQQYIASAAQAETYRTEPPFKLQGSYRNMNKLAEKISPVMNQAELQQLIGDHYQGEAQLLTTGAEENLLKLAELRGVLTPEQAARWTQIKRDFQRNKAMGAGEADVGGRVVAQLNDLVESVRSLDSSASKAAAAPAPVAPENPAPWVEILDLLERVAAAQSAPPPLAPTAPAPDYDALLGQLGPSLQHALDPLVGRLHDSAERQTRINEALVEIFKHLGERELQDAPTRAAMTEQQRELQRALNDFADRLNGRVQR